MDREINGEDFSRNQSGLANDGDEPDAAMPEHVRLAADYLSARGITADVAKAAGMFPSLMRANSKKLARAGRPSQFPISTPTRARG